MQKSRIPSYNYAEHVSDSQNFLTKRQLIRKILNLSSITKEDTVLEIGAGKGHLTEALCEKSGYVYSVEIDQKLYESTSVKLSQCTNLKLILGDFLKYSLPGQGSYKVFANIPFFITTQIIDKLTNASNPPSEAWLVMEKGAARRFAGFPKENKRSLLLKVGWETEVVYHFRREDFHPMPCVDSVLLHLKKKETPDLSKKEVLSFQKFIEHSMRHGLSGKQGLLTQKQVSTALKRAGLPRLIEMVLRCIFNGCVYFDAICALTAQADGAIKVRMTDAPYRRHPLPLLPEIAWYIGYSKRLFWQSAQDACPVQ